MSESDLMPAAWRGPAGDPDPVEANGLCLTDLSRRRRGGLKGRGALAWLAREGVTVPDTNNTAAVTEHRLLLARLSPGEALLLAVAEGGGAAIDALEDGRDGGRPAGCHPVPRQDMSAWFRLEGTAVPSLMAKLCAVDLRPAHFADRAVAQTGVALQNAIVIRDDRDGHLGFHVLTDFASGAYLWKVLARHVSAQGDAA